MKSVSTKVSYVLYPFCITHNARGNFNLKLKTAFYYTSSL